MIGVFEKVLPRALGALALTLCLAGLDARADFVINEPEMEEEEEERGPAPWSGQISDKATRMKIQRGLKALGHYDGPIDGVFGPETMEAIADYQNAEGDVPTGLLTGEQKADLVAEGARAPKAETAPVPQKAAPKAELDPLDAPYAAKARAMVRERPDVRAKTAFVLNYGDKVHALGKVKGTDWLLVLGDDGREGYVVSRMMREALGQGPRTATIDVVPARPAQKAMAGDIDFGRYYALVIGNNAYRGFPALKTAAADAKAVADALARDYGYQATVLLDAERDAIIRALEEFRRKLGPGDNLLIYYAGHGWLDKQAERGYWLPVDATEDSKANWISNATITDSLKAMAARHVMVVADSCYSGTLTRGIKITERGPDYWRALAAKRARVVMTSGGLEPVADAGGVGHSAFAKGFINALANNTGVADGAKLFAEVKRHVMVNADQTPEYADVRMAGHEGGDFVFVRTGAR